MILIAVHFYAVYASERCMKPPKAADWDDPKTVIDLRKPNVLNIIR
jgi:hypothetical protein